MCYNFSSEMEEQYPPMLFSEWLKRRRKALDMTQDELARRAGCSVGALRKIEAGDRRPSKQLAALLAKALDLSSDDCQMFIRAARGEINSGRLRQSSLPVSAPFSGLPVPGQAQQKTSQWIGAGPSRSRIPSQTTPLIGREAEMAALAKIFNDPQCRLLTLTGIGGIGKTRLAIEFAAKEAALFPWGVFYIPLTSVDSPDKIAPAVADVLGFGFSGPSDPKEQLINFLANQIDREALFIFDNLEHLISQSSTHAGKPGLVELISEILLQLPHVKILGTSRERLNIHGEWMYELHGLCVPLTDFFGKLEDYESIRLFVKSAQRVKADFHVTPEIQQPMVRICQLVDGVPLAIELAAGWAGLLSCQEIAQEIQSSMDFLTTSMRDLPERHRSIRATFDHSWKLLPEEEQRVLCRLSVFHGGFDRQAADQVAGASLALLASLSAKSLVRRTVDGRYDLHEVIRQYALSYLNSHPDKDQIYARHCDYYLAYLHRRQNSLKTASQQDAIRQLVAEIDNIRAAWTWAIHHKKYDQLGQAGRAFGWYFEIEGLYQAGIEQLESLVQSLKAEPQNERWNPVLGLALVHQALLHFRHGEFDTAIRRYEDSIAVLRPSGDRVLLADALIFLGTILYLNGNFDRGRPLLEEGQVYAQAAGERWLEAMAIANIGHITSMMGRPAEGYEQMMAGLSIWRTLGDPQAIAMGQNFLVPTMTKLGKYAQAKEFMQESIALCEQSKNGWGMGTAYTFWGLACLADGEYAAAKKHLLKSLDIFSDYTTGWNIARSLSYLGDATRLSGEPAEAMNIYREALRSSIEAKAIPIALDALAGMSILLDQAGEAQNALMLCVYITNHPSGEGETKLQAGGLCTGLERKLDSNQILAARRMAAEKSLDEIVKVIVEGG